MAKAMRMSQVQPPIQCTRAWSCVASNMILARLVKFDVSVHFRKRKADAERRDPDSFLFSSDDLGSPGECIPEIDPPLDLVLRQDEICYETGKLEIFRGLITKINCCR